MAVVLATDIEVGDWLEVGGRLREIEAVWETGFRGPDGWVHAVLMQLRGWTTVQGAGQLAAEDPARSGAAGVGVTSGS